MNKHFSCKRKKTNETRQFFAENEYSGGYFCRRC